MQLTAAPDLPADLEWLNTDRPLAVRDLAGRVVLLSFGTFACSSCMRLVPEIRRLKEEHPELVVIEIHSPGLEAEPVTENVREAVRRAGVDHPVAVDRDRRVWQAFGVRDWPTFVLIDPAGNVVGRTTGEGLYGRLNPKIARIEAEFERRGELSRQPLQPAAATEAGSLYRPGKIAADTAGMRLFVSDTGHHRIVVADAGGRILETIGSGTAGNADGPFTKAAFYRPEGLAFDEEAGILYVADTGNHTIRQISWPDRRVVTVAGTGLEAPAAGIAGPGTGVALSAPRDLALMGGHLYIAMAGSHQIWRMDLATHEVEPYAGSGREALADGPLEAAAFAGPSGLVTDGEALFVADRGASAIRRIKRGMVETFIGHSPDDFGDLDTIAGMARIHHAAGLAYHQGLIYLADTGNHKIKEFDPATGWVLTRVGNGNRGYRDGLSGDARLNEPHGLVRMGGLWYIADTGNHVVRVYDPTRHAVSTLNLWR
ncbi:redoxin domain-containing protein [Methanoculleus sp. Wushi-C6]|uniref:Redoxin domain-containing protein n=1 Tax=Methanoculleus caldifontis TaxID=2651577 RepID=A0ABU3X433_9EURY|nr:thioredoxin-like domain-containing protein [Methanoculleus sp. Wushi-C6]MDV2482819.1 redoxin domain-containing protein [Methanoculleus sp. Wushi-C6]